MPKRKLSPVHRSFYSELPENSFKVICTVVGITIRSFFTNIFENIDLYNSRSNDLTNERNLNYLRDCYIYRNESIILLYINCYRNVCCSHKCVIKNMFYKRSMLRLIDRIMEENVCSFTMISGKCILHADSWSAANLSFIIIIVMRNNTSIELRKRNDLAKCNYDRLF